MIERQPGRPTESGFIGAAVRFLGNEYEPEVVYVQTGYYAKARTFFPGRDIDIDIIKTEQLWDGRCGEPESLKRFAARQLALYKKSRKD